MRQITKHPKAGTLQRLARLLSAAAFLDALPSALCPFVAALLSQQNFRDTSLPVADSPHASASACGFHYHYHCYYNHQNLTLPFPFCYFTVLNSEQLIYFFFHQL
jgi:hypothetical protein